MSNCKTNHPVRSVLAQSIFAAAFALMGNSAMAAHVIYADAYPDKREPAKQSSASPSHIEYSSCGHALDQDRLEALGHTFSVFSPDDDGWADALAGVHGEGVIVVGECQAYRSISPETRSAISSYVNSGKKIIVVGDHNGSVEFINPTFGYSANVIYGCKSDESSAGTLTAAAAGTTFQVGPSEIFNLSCTSGLDTASLPAGAKTFYAGESDYYGGDDRPAAKAGHTSPSDISLYPTSLVWANAYGSGTVAWLGYDFACWDCGPDGAYDDDWYIVLDNALRYTAFTGSANLRLSFSGPSGQVRAGSPTQVYARLDNYGRNSAVNPVVHITASLPTANVVLASDPPGWLCTGDEQEDRSGSSTAALTDQVDITCRMNGSMPRSTVQFKLNIMPTSSPSGFHSFNGSASSDSTDPVPDNNSASFKLYVKAGGSVVPVVPPRT